MAKKDLAYGSWRPRFCVSVGLADLKISLDINTATPRQVPKVIVGGSVERENTVPCDTRVGTGCRKPSIVGRWIDIKNSPLTAIRTRSRRRIIRSGDDIPVKVTDMSKSNEYWGRDDLILTKHIPSPILSSSPRGRGQDGQQGSPWKRLRCAEQMWRMPERDASSLPKRRRKTSQSVSKRENRDTDPCGSTRNGITDEREHFQGEKGRERGQARKDCLATTLHHYQLGLQNIWIFRGDSSRKNKL